MIAWTMNIGVHWSSYKVPRRQIWLSLEDVKFSIQSKGFWPLTNSSYFMVAIISNGLLDRDINSIVVKHLDLKHLLHYSGCVWFSHELWKSCCQMSAVRWLLWKSWKSFGSNCCELSTVKNLYIVFMQIDSIQYFFVMIKIFSNKSLFLYIYENIWS
jgi:hypothetical protein